MKILVLEDDNNRIIKFKRGLIGHVVNYATTAAQGMSFINKNKYDIIFLDHDLGGHIFVDSHSDNTGFQLAKAIAVNDKNNDTFCVIHSCNPCGANNMMSILSHAIKIPFTCLDIDMVIKSCQ